MTRRGVLALAASDLTEKSERPEDLPDDIPGVSHRDFLQAIRTRVVGTYRLDPNRLKRDARREVGVSADYGGRYLWELIQNADDALSSDGMSTTHLIGTKGLGFKSVLEISDQPEVFSNTFAFRFCRTASESLLSELLSTKVIAPTFEIPHSAKASLEVAELLKRGYPTITLPWQQTTFRCNSARLACVLR